MKIRTYIEGRAAFVESSKALNKAVEIFKIEDRQIKGYKEEINVRIYRPNDSEFLAALVYFHGGGWVIGNIETPNKRKAPEISHQFLFYPSTGFEPTESYKKYGEGYYLTKSTMQWFGEQYLNQPSDTQNPLLHPY